MKISAGLDGSQLEAKGGIIAGVIDVQNVNTFRKFIHHRRAKRKHLL